MELAALVARCSDKNLIPEKRSACKGSVLAVCSALYFYRSLMVKKITQKRPYLEGPRSNEVTDSLASGKLLHPLDHLLHLSTETNHTKLPGALPTQL